MSNSSHKNYDGSDYKSRWRYSEQVKEIDRKRDELGETKESLEKALKNQRPRRRTTGSIVVPNLPWKK